MTSDQIIITESPEAIARYVEFNDKLRAELAQLKRRSLLWEQRGKWIQVSDRLPPDTGKPYQVIAAANKQRGGIYKGFLVRGFYQDWVVSQWPQNFVVWMDAPSEIYFKDKQ